MGEGAAEAVELPDDEHVARPERAHVTVESRSVVYAGREVLVDVDGVDARSAAGAPCSRGERVAALPESDQLRGTPILVTDRRGDTWTTTLTDVVSRSDTEIVVTNTGWPRR